MNVGAAKVKFLRSINKYIFFNNLAKYSFQLFWLCRLIFVITSDLFYRLVTKKKKNRGKFMKAKCMHLSLFN